MTKGLTRANTVGRLIALALVMAGVHAAPALATQECIYFESASCTSAVGPWVAVPAVNGAVGIGNWTLNCPGGSAYAVGFDITASASSLPIVSGVYGFSAGAAPLGQMFFGVSAPSLPAAFQPVIGCVPASQFAPPPGTGGAAPGRLHAARVRVREVRLRAGANGSYTHECARGETLLRSGAGIGFFTRRPPSTRVLRGIRYVRTVHHGRIVVRASTSSAALAGERVDLQIQAVCKRS
jgi:hypothetical protein